MQYHPEAAAGPHDAGYLFDRFADLMLPAPPPLIMHAGAIMRVAVIRHGRMIAPTCMISAPCMISASADEGGEG